MSLVWFITGATRGLGAAMAQAALAAGDRVIATGRRRDDLTKTFGRDGDQALLLALDVTNEAAIAQSVHAALAKFGRIDVLVNNAGYSHFGMFEETTSEEVEHQYATNVFGLMNITRAVLPSMRKQRSGRIFNVSSIGGVYGRAPGSSLYCGTKFAVEGFSESLAMEVRPFGISVTIVEPGYFRTDFLDPSSARFGRAAIEDYAETAAKQRAFIQERNHNQTGDPAKLGEALVALSREPLPPLRFAAGSDAVAIVKAKAKALMDEVDAWRSLSVSTDAN